MRVPGGCPERAPSSCDHVQSPSPHSTVVTKCPVHADQVPALPELMSKGRSPVPVSYKTTDLGDGAEKEGRTGTLFAASGSMCTLTAQRRDQSPGPGTKSSPM